MSDISALILAFVVGTFLGVIFFGGLWWTVQRGMTSESPALWFFGSLMLRTGIVLTGFYFVAREDLSRVATCILGFLIARFIIVKKFSQTPMDETSPLEEEMSNAPYS